MKGDTSTWDSRYDNFIRDLQLNEPLRYYLISSSICKSIIGHPYLKGTNNTNAAGLLLCLLGGTPIFDHRGGLVKRGNIHCLLIGRHTLCYIYYLFKIILIILLKNI